MPRPESFLAIQALRAERRAIDAQLAEATHAADSARRKRDALNAAGAEAHDLADAQQTMEQARERYHGLRADRSGLLAALVEQSAATAADQAGAAELFNSLEGDLPISLFPVRLETRYDTDPVVLQVRIYPDACNVQRHAAGVTESEQSAGLAYWQASWDARPPRIEDEADPAFESDEQFRMRQQRPEALWAEMVRALRAPRAAFVVRALRPDNAGLLDQPGVPAEPPAFPEGLALASRLSAQPVAVMLPDRFCAVGYARGGQMVFRKFGSVVPDVLPMSPIIGPGDPPLPDDAEPPFAGEAAWLADYAKAEAQGMAISIRGGDVLVNGYNLSEGLERLLVIGIDWTLSPEDAAAGIGALLDAHTASGGMAFLPVGTPTNNVAAESAGHSPAFDRDAQRNTAPAATPAPGTRAIEALRTAFGIAPADFTAETLVNADLDEPALAGHMINALYRGLAGDYLHKNWQPAKDDPASDDALDSLRQHAVRFVRPAGPLQPLRIDRQPYAILPVVAGAAYQPGTAFESGLTGILKLLRPSWEAAIGGVKRFDGTPATTNLILRQGPWAQTASYREVSPDQDSEVKKAVGSFQSGLRASAGSFFLKALETLHGPQAATVARLSTLAIHQLAVKPDTNALPRAMAWVQADAEVKTREAAPDSLLPPDDNYIRKLADAVKPAHDLKGDAARLRSAPSLLAGLLAYSVDLEADRAGEGLVTLAIKGLDPKQQVRAFRTPISVGVEAAVEDEQTFTLAHAGELSQVRLPGITGKESITTFAVGQAARAASIQDVAFAQWHEVGKAKINDRWRAGTTRHARDLASVVSSLGALANRKVGELNWSFRTTLDLFDWRLDAWYTSLATRRLAELRSATDANGEPAVRGGLHVGAWGYVEGLKPDPAGHSESAGHMLMPSMRHAAAAAVLRSAFQSNDAAAKAAFDLDLSSQRVRAGKAVFEGLAQGQTLAALLGYRFERGLHDALLGQYLLDFRLVFPLHPVSLNAQGRATGQPKEAIAARDVVDGVQLLDQSPAQILAQVPSLAALGAGHAHWQAIVALLVDLDRLWDAVADLSVAEAVFQIAQGNVERAAAALAVLDKQTTPIEPQMPNSPRDGLTYTQRVMLMLNDANPPAGWPEDALSLAEPRINAWLGQLIGNPTNFTLRARVFVGDVLENEALEITPADLGLSPLALLMALDAPGAGRTDVRTGPADMLVPPDPNKTVVAEMSRLRLRLAEVFSTLARQQAGDGAFVHIEEAPANGKGSGLLHLECLLALARRLVTQSRPALRGDLAVIEPKFDRQNTEGDYPGADAAELDARAVAAASPFGLLAQALLDLIPADEAAPLDVAATEAALAALRPFAVLGAESEDHRSFADAASAMAALRRRASAARSDLTARGEALQSQREAASAAGAKPAAIVQAAIDTLKTVFGRDFPVVPLFSLGERAASVQSCLENQKTLTAGRPSPVAGWLPKMAKVRGGAEKLQSLLLAREMLAGAYADDCFAVVQSPATKDGVWAALPEAWPDAPAGDVAKTDILAGGRRRPDLAVALHAATPLPETIKDDTPLAGLVCDDWAETVPTHTSTAAVAFHYDAPNARPPQAILLAVPPRPQMAHWTFADVLATVEESIALAKLRAVTPNQLAGPVSLALPMNIIPDVKSALVPGLGISAMSKYAYTIASVGGAKKMPIGQV
ncbi:MAG: hypothetical protein KA945_03620 [Zoogloea sp.]|nr:hypothetical protein [Zoogloea sp.]